MSTTIQIFLFISLISALGLSPVWSSLVSCPSIFESEHNERWQKMQQVGKCYGTIQYGIKRFGDAEVWCRKRGGHLAMPKSSDEINNLKNVFSFLRIFWIGLTDLEEGHWKWLDGNIIREEQIQHFTQSQLSNSNDERCGQMDNQGIWYDADCNEKANFVCEISVNIMFPKNVQERRCPHMWVFFECGEFCYRLIQNPINFRSAKSECTRLNAKVAMPKTRGEHIFFMHVLSSRVHPDDFGLMYSEAWIGLTKVTGATYDYSWIDGTLESWINWGSSRPGQYFDCLTMNPSGLINARRCAQSSLVICQKPQKSVHIPRISIIPITADEECGETAVASIIVAQKKSFGIEEFPWIVRINKKCTGVLIGPKHVLTTAYCVTKDDHAMPAYKVDIRIGSSDADIKSGKPESVHNIRIHIDYMGPKYFSPTHNDIAVIELKRNVDLECPTTKAACFSNNNDPSFKPPFTGYECVLAGWGESEKSLQYCKIDTTDTGIYEYYPGKTFKVHTAHCLDFHVESGSPLLCRKENQQWQLAGFQRDEISGQFSVLVNPRHSFYMTWIEDTTQRYVIPEQKKYRITVCEDLTEDDVLDISCDHGRPPAIRFLRVEWGRVRANVCPTEDMEDAMSADCVMIYEDNFNEICGGKNRCRMPAHRRYLGEPSTCRNDFPSLSLYLFVNYTCVFSAEMKYDTCTTKQSYAEFSCGIGNQLSMIVTSAHWGTSEQPTCFSIYLVNGRYNETCTGVDITDKVRLECDDKESCFIPLETLNTPDPCSGYEKVFRVTYKCFEDNTYNDEQSASSPISKSGLCFPCVKTILVLCLLPKIFTFFL